MRTSRVMRLAVVPLAAALWLGVAPAVYADEPDQGNGTFAISFAPMVEHVADGNTFIDYTFAESTVGIVTGTRIGSGELVVHADGSFNTINTGTFTGTIDGRSGTAEMSFRGSGTFALAGGTYVVTQGTDALAGVHAEGTDSGSATGPTTFAGTYSFKVTVSGP
jgi:hypothetical protein